MTLPPDAAARRSDAIAYARAWVGTPYRLGAARQGVGADCLGLIEGVAAQLQGLPVPPRPPYRPDWSATTDLLAEGAYRGFAPIELGQLAPGDVVAIRYTSQRPEHLAVMASEKTIIHAVEGRGVVEVHLAELRRRVMAAALFPGAT